MKIKEVEESVGISSNNIRFYEEMGLLHIERNPESKYRDFQKKDVDRLKEIKVFRGLGVTMEEIRRYYSGEISLEDMMEHQVNELKSQHSEMELKEALCKKIRDDKLPLVSYSVKQYDSIIQNKTKKASLKQAGGFISSWNTCQYTKKRMVLMECLCFPILWIFVSLPICFLWSTPKIVETGRYAIEYNIFPMILATLLTAMLCVFDFYFMMFPKELYEFRENGIYYIKKSNRRSFFKIRKAVKQNKIEEYMDFLPYTDLEIFKIWFHVCAKAPLGANVYQLDFILRSVYDEVIRIDTGMIGVSDEKVRLTMEILKEKAKKMLDPFQILPHIDLERKEFYEYLDKVYQRKEHLRVFHNLEHIKK